MAMLNSPLEFLSRQYENVVKYDANGVPSIFVKFPKMKSSDLDASLPDHIHPAFIINGVEQDYILLGKYMGCCVDGTQTGTIYSLPNLPPAHTRTADQFLTQCRAFGNGASGMTVADRGFLLLLAQKNGWDPGGNSDYGHCYKDAARYTIGQAVTAGTKIGYRGWLWECLTAHTCAAELAPEISPTYWKKLKQIGGVEAYPTMHTSGQNNTYLILNGSGPESWFLSGTSDSLCDIVGNASEQDYGYRIVGGEMQILPNNNAADENADLSESSAAWRAILPNAGNDGYTLVAPGTAGTLHWTWANAKITLDTAIPDFNGETHRADFKNIVVNSANLPFVPSIVRELGLFPTAGSTTNGTSYFTFAQGELFPRRGGDFSRGSIDGLGCEYSAHPRSRTERSYGVRLRTCP